MSGLFGVVSNNSCISSVYYETDYHSHLGFNSLKYQLLDDTVEAIRIHKDKLCLYCWTGKGFQKSLNDY